MTFMVSRTIWFQTSKQRRIVPEGRQQTVHLPQDAFFQNVKWLQTNPNIFLFLFLFLISLSRDLSENQIQAIPRKAFRGITAVKNL